MKKQDKESPEYINNLIGEATELLKEKKKEIQSLESYLNHKTEYLNRLQAKVKSLHAEKLEKELQKNRLYKQLRLLSDQYTPDKKIQIERSNALKFVKKTPKEGIDLLISELSAMNQIVSTAHKSLHAVSDITEYQVYYQQEVCFIRSSNKNYSFEELCRDAATYFSFDPDDFLLKDAHGSIYPNKASIADHYSPSSKLILSLKFGRAARVLRDENTDWQIEAAHHKLDERIKAMAAWDRRKSKLNAKKRGHRESSIFLSLCMFFLYLAFLIQLCYFVFTHIDLENAYHLNNGLKEVFVEELFPADCSYPDGASITFLGIQKPHQFFCWFENVLIGGIFAEDAEEETNRIFILKYNQLGGIRIRQLRVAEDSCKTLDYSTNHVYDYGEAPCYNRYEPQYKSKDAYGPALQSIGCSILSRSSDCLFRKAFTFSEDIPNSFSVSGLFSEYDETGFYIDSTDLLDDNRLLESTMTDLVSYLKQNLWIDIQTRAIVINFSTYNINYDYFSTVELILEFGVSSNINVYYRINSLYLSYYYNSWVEIGDSFGNFMRKVPEAYCYVYNFLGILGHVIRQIKKKETRTEYLQTMWCYIDMLLFVLVSGIMITRAIIFVESKDIVELVEEKSFDFVLNFSKPTLLTGILWGFEAFGVLFGCMKFLNYFEIKSMTLIWDTLSRGAKAIFAFFLVYVVLISSFAMMTHVVYGYQLYHFSSIYQSIASLFIVILGDIEKYEEMSLVEPYFTPVFFIAFMFLMFFVIMNIFVAILNESFGVVADHQRGYEEKAVITRLGKRIKEEFIFYRKKLMYSLGKCVKRNKGNQSKAYKNFIK